MPIAGTSSPLDGMTRRIGASCARARRPAKGSAARPPSTARRVGCQSVMEKEMAPQRPFSNRRGTSLCLLAPAAKRDSGSVERSTTLGQRIDNLGRQSRIGLTIDEPVALHLAQLLDQHLLADRRDRLPQAAEPARRRCELTEDVDLPLAFNRLDRRREAAGFCGFVHNAL